MLGIGMPLLGLGENRNPRTLVPGFLKCFSESVSATSKEFLLQRGGQLNVILDLGAAVSR